MNSKTSKLVCGLTLLILLSVASVAFAVRGTADVANTVHNLSAGGPVWSLYVTDESQVCIFCHTPHGGNLDGPLWNRAAPASGGFNFYSSTTISAEVKGVTKVNPESLICLACHDGSLSVNHLLNYSSATPVITTTFGGGLNTTITGSAGASPRIGGNPATPGATGELGDDHPISFSYYNVWDAYNTAGRAGLHPADDARADGVQFFGIENTADGDRVECSSCHDPHVDYEIASPTYAPFLIMPNDGSKLCLACHNK
jgi:mono/diheme cytochrome c family protein